MAANLIVPRSPSVPARIGLNQHGPRMGPPTVIVAPPGEFDAPHQEARRSPRQETASGQARQWRALRTRRSLTCADAFRRLATGCLAEIAANQHAADLGQVDAVHRMRVGITRLRAAVSFFAPMTADKVWPRLKDELRWLNRALGSARDVDVVVENLRHQRYRQLTLAGIEKDLERRSKKTRTRLNTALHSARFQRFLTSASEWIERGPWTVRTDARTVSAQDQPIGPLRRASDRAVAQEADPRRRRPRRHEGGAAPSPSHPRQAAALHAGDAGDGLSRSLSLAVSAGWKSRSSACSGRSATSATSSACATGPDHRSPPAANILPHGYKREKSAVLADADKAFRKMARATQQ